MNSYVEAGSVPEKTFARYSNAHKLSGKRERRVQEQEQRVLGDPALTSLAKRRSRFCVGRSARRSAPANQRSLQTLPTTNFEPPQPANIENLPPGEYSDPNDPPSRISLRTCNHDW